MLCDGVPFYLNIVYTADSAISVAF